jgi:hypothetical protein
MRSGLGPMVGQCKDDNEKHLSLYLSIMLSIEPQWHFHIQFSKIS